MAQGRRGRRLMGEINVVPYIDVMLVLLIIFMVTAPLLTQGVKVELPKAGAEPIEVKLPRGEKPWSSRSTATAACSSMSGRSRSARSTRRRSGQGPRRCCVARPSCRCW